MQMFSSSDKDALYAATKRLSKCNLQGAVKILI